MIISKNLLNKVYKKYKLSFKDGVDYDKAQFLWDKRHLVSVNHILTYNKPDSLEVMFDMISRCLEIGSAFSLEKNIIMYGEDKGTEKFNSRDYGITLEKMIKKHGEIVGNQKWNTYCEKQAYSNSFEYKQKKYGWDKVKFDEFNASRSQTLDKMIERHGELLGAELWKKYCERQAFTNSKEYLKDRYEKVNKQKGHTIESYIERYGEKEGTDRFLKFAENVNVGCYSKISQDLFWVLHSNDIFKNKKCYFAELNNEYGIFDKKQSKYYKYDFVCPELKLCIEFNGDHYHGNPKIYSPDDYLVGKGCTEIKAKDMWETDKNKLSLIENLRDFSVVVVWESDYKKDKDKVIEGIIEYATIKSD